MSREGYVSPNEVPGEWPQASGDHVPVKESGRKTHGVRNSRWFVISLLPLALSMVAFYEARTSAIEAKLLASFASKLHYTLGPGASPAIVFPDGGPFNEARGYSKLPAFNENLRNRGFHIVEQARLSSELERIARWRITPPYREPAVAGLVVRGEKGRVLYDGASREYAFKSYEEIPPLAARALLFIENRELEDSSISTRNPVVDWARLAKAGFLYTGHKLGLPFRVEGGSTLATQIEKFRYADGGRTNSASDKLRQMLAAALRVYQAGTDTTAERREIVLDYLNSMPLAAAPEYGEVHGLGNGLYAWFGIELDQALSTLHGPASEEEQERIAKHVLAAICAARAPSFYLQTNRSALEDRIDYYVRQLESSGVLSPEFSRGVQDVPLQFLDRAPSPPRVSYLQRKATNAIRAHVMKALDLKDLYALDRLHLEADTGLDMDLQNQVMTLFQKLKDPSFVDAQGLRTEHLLQRGDPSQVTYSFTLFERTSAGNVLRVQADTLNQPFDLNEGMKLELGSTAKLRTLAHYLELVASLFEDFRGLDAAALSQQVQSAKDPITKWTAETLRTNAGIKLPALLELAVQRKYSGNPGEVFFTGGGAHVFANFEKSENGMFYDLREGLKHSVNLVYIRLMRDLVRFHAARLPYDADAVLNNTDDPVRLSMLHEISDKESKQFLYEAYKTYRSTSADAIVDRVLGNGNKSMRHLSMLFLAWNPKADADALGQWLQKRDKSISSDEVRRLFKSYDPGRLNISDYGYLLNRHPLEVWCAGELSHDPNASWDDILQRSADVRELSSQWLFKTQNRRAQDLRLRIRFEQDAFARMTPYWRRLGFPFNHLVPSLATAIGSSADRPIALAQLVGTILNDGVRLPLLNVTRLRFAADTPYETVLAPNPSKGEHVMDPAVAQTLRGVLAGVVQDGTAVRLNNAFIGTDGKPVIAGGKTGSGDNRYETFGRGGYVKSSRAVSRTGTFVFYIGDQYFGVMTAYVGGPDAAKYGFTSALPVATLKLLAPAITASLAN
jgi:membrane peptidoglycan carboxypeptidase